jgi:hypothetical protein
MILPQPRREFAFHFLAFRDAKSWRDGTPPIRHASVTHGLTIIEKRSWLGGAKEFSACAAALDSEEGQSIDHIIQILLKT